MCPPYCRSMDEDFFTLLSFSRISVSTDTEVQNDRYRVRDALSRYPGLAFSIRRITPLIFHNAVQSGLIDNIATKTKNQIKSDALHLIADEMIKKRWLQNILIEFGDRSIPTILLKGSAYSGTLYPQESPRVGQDIDLLVRASDFKYACDTLNQHMNPIGYDPKRIATYRNMFERTFSPRDSTASPIDLHRELTSHYLFNIKEETLWESSRPHPNYNNSNIRYLSSEDCLLHLATHALRDIDFCSHNLLDAHEIFCQWRPQPDLLIARARNWGATKTLYYLLSNCKSVLNTPVPDSLLDALAPNALTIHLGRQLLSSHNSRLTQKKTALFRLMQLLGQFLLTDNPLQVLRHQSHYTGTRIMDWHLSKRK